jgi:2-dehydropantoate 2-reductase
MAQSENQQRRASVAVVGLGGIGGTAAGLLSATGRHDVIACVRRPLAHLVVEGPDATIDVPLNALTDPAQASPVDWVLLCTKAHETATAGAWLERLCTPSTRVAVLQNGVDHEERVAPYAQGATVVPALVYYNGERLAPGHVRFRPVSAHALVVRDDVAGRAFAELMQGTPLSVQPSGDFITLKWRKLLLNSVVNPITALTLQRFAVFRRDDVHALCLAILEEAVQVAAAAGAKLATDEPARTMAVLMSFAPELGSSMYFDRQAGRSLEIEALTGAIVAAGTRYNIPTPLNRALLTLLRAVNDAVAKQPETKA